MNNYFKKKLLVFNFFTPEDYLIPQCLATHTAFLHCALTPLSQTQSSPAYLSRCQTPSLTFHPPLHTPELPL